jgi:hypothetical protein
VALSPQANKEFSVRYWVRELCLLIEEKKIEVSFYPLFFGVVPVPLVFGVILVLCCEKREIYQ